MKGFLQIETPEECVRKTQQMLKEDPEGAVFSNSAEKEEEIYNGLNNTSR